MLRRGMLVGLLLGAQCASDSPSPLRRVARTLTLEISGGTCEACWRRFSLVEYHTVELRDTNGIVEVTLSDDEATQLRDIAQSDALFDAVEAASDRECSSNALDNVLQLEWTDGGRKTVVVSDGCGGHCSEPDHPFMRLKRALFALKAAHLDCPESPAYVCAVAPAIPAPAIGRMLCAQCRDDCGIAASDP